ncbi:MAG: N4-gp56 family major capsid protein [Gammaproteobacteria bacterium]
MALTISATDTELPKPLNAVFQQTLLRNAQVRAPYFIGTEAAALSTQNGSNVAMWRRIENLAAATSALTELTTTASYMQGRGAAALSVTNVTATMAKYGNFVILNEEVSIFNFPGQFDKIMQVIGINAGQSLNRLQRDIGEDNATLIYANGSSDGAVNTKLDANDLKNVINTIDKLSAMTFNPMTTGSINIGTTPTLPAYWGLCHPDVALDIAALTGFNSVETYAGQIQTVMGEFGSYGIAGQAIRFVSSEDAGVDAGSGALSGVSVRETSAAADLYTTLIYGQDAIGSVGLGQRYSDGVYRAGAELDPVDVIVKAPSATGTSDPFNEITTIAWKAWHTGAILNPAWVRGIRSAAGSL